MQARLLLLLAVLFVTLSWNGAASAAAVTVTGSTLIYTAAPGESNRVAISLSGGVYTVRDSGAPITVSGACAASSKTEATCFAAGVAALQLSLGDRDDSTALSAATPAFVDGGDGPDRLGGGPSADFLSGGEGDDELVGGGAGDTFFGGGGNDTVSYADASTRVSVDIDDAADDGATGEGDNVRSDVENLIGSAYDDSLGGSDAANVLDGRGENDTLSGRGGNDSLLGGDGDRDLLDGGDGADDLSGGEGYDSATYIGRAAGVTVTIDGSANDGATGEGDNVRLDIEGVYGGYGDDVLTGTDGDDYLDGLGGDDTIHGLGGVDYLYGGFDDDRIYGGPGDDAFIRGSDGIDVLDGGDGDDRLEGGAHDDALTGGRGADWVNGGSGVDLASYADHTGDVGVWLDGAANDGSEAEDRRGDNLLEIENVKGGYGDDLLNGSVAAVNRLDGGKGNDTLNALGPDDRLVGRDGDDWFNAFDFQVTYMDGGLGRDTAYFDLRLDGLTSIEVRFPM